MPIYNESDVLLKAKLKEWDKRNTYGLNLIVAQDGLEPRHWINDFNVTYAHFEQNYGRGGHRDRCVQSFTSDCEVFSWVDGDDWFDPIDIHSLCVKVFKSKHVWGYYSRKRRINVSNNNGSLMKFVEFINNKTKSMKFNNNLNSFHGTAFMSNAIKPSFEYVDRGEDSLWLKMFREQNNDCGLSVPINKDVGYVFFGNPNVAKKYNNQVGVHEDGSHYIYVKQKRVSISAEKARAIWIERHK